MTSFTVEKGKKSEYTEYQNSNIVNWVQAQRENYLKKTIVLY